MARETAIEWADATWNPVRGCTEVSPGCAHCYAKANSFRNPAVLGEWGPNGTRVVGAADNWRLPVRWAKAHLRAVLRGEAEARPLRIFTASLADIFEDHPVVTMVRTQIWLDTIPALSALRLPDGRPAAVLLTLTKRANIAAAWFRNFGCPDVVWPGVTVEDQQRADERLPLVLGLPRLWLSVEPLLGPVALADAHLAALDWIIVGGESGPGARPMHPNWARSLRDQCVAAGVPYFFKQWGEWAPGEEVEANGTGWTGMYEASPADGGGVPVHFWPDALLRKTAIALGRTLPDARHLSGDTSVMRVGKKAAGRLLDGREWSEVPNV